MISACYAVMLDAGLWIFIPLRRTGFKGILFLDLSPLKTGFALRSNNHQVSGNQYRFASSSRIMILFHSSV